MVHLQEHGGAPFREALEDVELPQRLGGVERAREHASDGTLELEPPARGRDRGPPQVKIEVESIVVDPQRTREPERHAHHSLTQPRGEMQPRLHDALHVVVGEGAVVARIEDRDAGDVHVHGGRLQVQEARVEARETFRRHRDEGTLRRGWPTTWC